MSITEGSPGNTRYTQVKVSVDSVIASAFKVACTTANVSMASIISKFMADFADIAVRRKKLEPDYSTRGQRRKSIQRILHQLEQIKFCEEQYRDRIPENLQGSEVYDRAEELVSALDEAIESLSQAGMVP